MKHFYERVPGIGNVAVTRHAQNRAARDKISQRAFDRALLAGESVPDGIGTVTREFGGVRLVIVERPEPFHGAALVTTVYRVQQQARAR